MPATCPNGAEYLALVRTHSGYTPTDLWHEKAWGLIDIPSIDDFNEWESLATRLRDMAYTRLYGLGAIEESRQGKLPAGAMLYPRYTAMREIYEPLNARVVALQDAYSLGNLFSADTPELTVTRRLGELAQVSTELACLIERIDAEVATYGVAPDPLSKTAADKEKDMGIIGKILFVGAAVGIVGGTVLVARRLAK